MTTSLNSEALALPELIAGLQDMTNRMRDGWSSAEPSRALLREAIRLLSGHQQASPALSPISVPHLGTSSFTLPNGWKDSIDVFTRDEVLAFARSAVLDDRIALDRAQRPQEGSSSPPSLPHPITNMLVGDDSEDVFTADQMNTRWADGWKAGYKHGAWADQRPQAGVEAVRQNLRPRDPIILTARQLKNALEFAAPDFPLDEDQQEAPVSIAWCEDREIFNDDGEQVIEPAGFWCWLTDYPEEGGIPLIDEYATPTQTAAVGASSAHAGSNMTAT